MLDINKKNALDQLVASFSKEELIWSSGYVLGLGSDFATIGKDSKASKVKDLTILYITETGNSKFLALELTKKLKSQGANVKLKSVEQYRLTDFAKEKNLVLISSTHGEGEIPDAGKKFYDHISQNELDLSQLHYAVISLGDSNYPLFCQSGKDIDARLEALKAKKLTARIDLDLDFEDSIENIFSQLAAAFSGQEAPKTQAIKSAKKDFEGEIISNINLNDIGSGKETRHLEIAVEDGELNYEPGDSIGILLENDALEVEGKITPRLYSISSSLNEHGNEVHLTISVLRYLDQNGETVAGLFSSHLARLKPGAKIKFYISRNRNFKLPADDKDIIMVGPGTGIAPFRSFIAERNYRLASGKSWLFFGERNAQSDFLYQSEWQDHLSSGILTKMDVAFSRDQDAKMYVQDRIKENGAEIFKWLENGAYFYICGDKEKMAKDVEKQLLETIKIQGNKTIEEAKSYLEKLIKTERFLKDVY